MPPATARSSRDGHRYTFRILCKGSVMQDLLQYETEALSHPTRHGRCQCTRARATEDSAVVRHTGVPPTVCPACHPGPRDSWQRRPTCRRRAAATRCARCTAVPGTPPTAGPACALGGCAGRPSRLLAKPIWCPLGELPRWRAAADRFTAAAARFTAALGRRRTCAELCMVWTQAQELVRGALA